MFAQASCVSLRCALMYYRSVKKPISLKFTTRQVAMDSWEAVNAWGGVNIPQQMHPESYRMETFQTNGPAGVFVSKISSLFGIFLEIFLLNLRAISPFHQFFWLVVSFNPFEKICQCSSNWIISPSFVRVKIPKIFELPPTRFFWGNCMVHLWQF